MFKYILMEQLIANALIELMRKKAKREVELTKLVAYGDAIVAKLDNAILLVSRDYTDAAIHNYSDYFDYDHDTDKFILKGDRNVDDLVNDFRAFLRLDILRAFIAPEVVEVLVA